MRERRSTGFTLIELMVVVAIVILAMGIMTPTLLEFFKNQRLKNVRTHFSSAFNISRLIAITEGTAVRVVFFREGVRVFHVRNQAFRKDEEFNPEAAPGSLTGITFDLRFARMPNSELPAYREWEKTQFLLNASPTTPGSGTCQTEGLVALEFQRDGTINWLKGENVPATAFNKDPPEDGDIIVVQEGNPEGLFLDIRRTGQVRAKIGPAPGSRLAEETRRRR